MSAAGRDRAAAYTAAKGVIREYRAGKVERDRIIVACIDAALDAQEAEDERRGPMRAHYDRAIDAATPLFVSLLVFLALMQAIGGVSDGIDTVADWFALVALVGTVVLVLMFGRLLLKKRRRPPAPSP